MVIYISHVSFLFPLTMVGSHYHFPTLYFKHFHSLHCFCLALHCCTQIILHCVRLPFFQAQPYSFFRPSYFRIEKPIVSIHVQKALSMPLSSSEDNVIHLFYVEPIQSLIYSMGLQLNDTYDLRAVCSFIEIQSLSSNKIIRNLLGIITDKLHVYN